MTKRKPKHPTLADKGWSSFDSGDGQTLWFDPDNTNGRTVTAVTVEHFDACEPWARPIRRQLAELGLETDAAMADESAMIFPWSERGDRWSYFVRVYRALDGRFAEAERRALTLLEEAYAEHEAWTAEQTRMLAAWDAMLDQAYAEHDRREAEADLAAEHADPLDFEHDALDEPALI